MFNETLLDVGRMLAQIEWPQLPELDEDEVKQKWCKHIRDRAAGRPGATFTYHEIGLLESCDGRRNYLPADVCAVLGVERRTSYFASIFYARSEVRKCEDFGPGRAA